MNPWWYVLIIYIYLAIISGIAAYPGVRNYAETHEWRTSDQNFLTFIGVSGFSLGWFIAVPFAFFRFLYQDPS